MQITYIPWCHKQSKTILNIHQLIVWTLLLSSTILISVSFTFLFYSLQPPFITIFKNIHLLPIFFSSPTSSDLHFPGYSSISTTYSYSGKEWELSQFLYADEADLLAYSKVTLMTCRRKMFKVHASKSKILAFKRYGQSQSIICLNVEVFKDANDFRYWAWSSIMTIA